MPATASGPESGSPPGVVEHEPGVQIVLQLLQGAIDLLAQRHAEELLLQRAVEPLTEAFI